MRQFNVLSPLLVILFYSLGIIAASLGVIYFQLPDNILLIFTVVIIVAAFFYGRRVYLTLILVTIPPSVLVVAQQAPGGFSDAVLRILIVTFSAVLIAEVTHYINSRLRTAEEAVIRSHEQYRTLLENINDVAYILDPQERFSYVSPAIKQISKYQVQDLIGKHYSEFVHPEDLPILKKNIAEIYAGRGKLSQFRFLDADQSWKYVHTFGRPIFEKGSLQGLTGILVDVSQYVEVQQALQLRQKQLAQLNEITRAALIESEFIPTLQALADRLGKLFDSDGCYITLWDDHSKQVKPIAAYGLKREEYRHHRPISNEKTMTVSVLEAGVPLAAEDVFNSPYISSRLAEDFPTVSMLGLPLIAGGRWLGAALITYNKTHEFSEEDLIWAETVSIQVSLAVYKGWVLEQERNQREVAESLKEAGVALSETLDLDEVLDRLLPQIQKVVPYDCGVIMWVAGNKARVVRQHGWEDHYPPNIQERIKNLELEIPKIPNFYRLYESQKALYIPDVKKHKDWIHIEGIDRQRSWAGMPIIAEGKVIAFYSLESEELDRFRPEHLYFLRAFAAQASLAIQNAQRYAQATRQMKESETLRRASSAVISELDLENVLSQILEQLEKVVPYDSAAVFILDGESMRILAARGFNHPAEVIGLRVDRQNPLFKEINLRRQPLILENAQLDPRFGGWAGTETVKGWMGVPLVVQGEIIGQLTIDNQNPSAYSDRDARLVLDFATEASIAIQHARLYQAAVKTANRLSILHQASQQISAILDPLQLYEAIHHAAAQVMPTESFVISLVDENKQEIEVVYLVDRLGRSPYKRIPIGQGLSGHIIHTGKSVQVNDPADDLDFEVLQFGDPDPVKSFLAVPMHRQDGSVFGMVSAQSYQTNAYTKEDLDLLELLAAHASVALDNNRLFAELQRLAILDDLTGLYNRRHFFEIARLEFERARRYGRVISLIMLDIDHFKEVNDQLGHLVGDQVLRLVAQRFRQNMRETDIIGRYGGEEFILLMPETGPEGAAQVAERLRVAVSNTPLLTLGHSVQITVSVGTASLTRGISDLDQLISQADNAMYAAKRNQQN